jgi:hypothetical protein
VNGGKGGGGGGQGPFLKPNWPNLNLTFCTKNFLLVANFILQIKSNTARVSKLKNTLKDEKKLTFFYIFGKFKFHCSF